jgi:NADH-quinone oxidoreductase subunit J
MMLDIQITTLMYNIKRYLPLALLFAGIILAEIIYLTVFKTSKVNIDTFIRSKNNTEQIGDVLYTKYFIDFQLSGIVLLLAMIGAIVLTHVYRPTIKRQNIDSQNSTTAKDRVQLVKIKPGEGIKDD